VVPADLIRLMAVQVGNGGTPQRGFRPTDYARMGSKCTPVMAVVVPGAVIIPSVDSIGNSRRLPVAFQAQHGNKQWAI
jgi:hypothetical protein